MALVAHRGCDQGKIPTRTWFCRGLNRRVNRERTHSGWYFMRTYGKRENPINYKNLFKVYLTRIKK